ncbi:hypothetical protein BH20ACI2_BH20ACI2_11170 [soil metagenome]
MLADRVLDTMVEYAHRGRSGMHPQLDWVPLLN